MQNFMACRGDNYAEDKKKSWYTITESHILFEDIIVLLIVKNLGIMISVRNLDFFQSLRQEIQKIFFFNKFK